MKDVIVPAVLAGRRVLSNIDGLDPDAVRGYCLDRCDDASKLGEVINFHGEDALKPGFFPDESTGDSVTFVKGGDLLVFDEWALTFPRRGKEPAGCNVEAFLRWHRHLTGPGGEATDVAIGTQVPADININYRPLVARSYKFKKLTALGAEGTYAWLLFDGHLQPKGGHYRNGTGKYDPAIFPLYASSSAAKEGTHVELKTNKKDSVRGSWQFWAVVVGVPLMILGGLFWLYRTYTSIAEPAAPVAAPAVPGAAPGAVPVAAGGVPVAAPAPSPWRIVGQVDGLEGSRVVIADDKGATRLLKPDGFSYDEGRPVTGWVDGRQVHAEDRLPSGSSDPLMSGFAQ